MKRPYTFEFIARVYYHGEYSDNVERLTKDRSYESKRIGDNFSQRVSNQFNHAYEDYYGDNGFAVINVVYCNR